MRGIAVALLLALTITSVAIFYPDKEGARGPQQLPKSKFETYGYNYNGSGLGVDKGVAHLYMQESRKRMEPGLIDQLEKRAESLPGVLDIKIVAYLDNLIVGVLTDGRNHTDMRNTANTYPNNRRTFATRMHETTDGFHKDIIRVLRPRLQAESRYNNIYIATQPAMYERISEFHQRIHRGEKLTDDEFISLLNDMGYITRGYNLVD
ncbi:sporulation protein [Brevibacillus fluminis]|uniref:Sporulation protein n=1 Tax=Brevibacillus fluminis TaxID=511487 RepID=A0A3M8DAC0_9BACL|nr:YhcN/YlaJ family sporulation lipoprotein [Brevibacillus fluminis]RNB85012.1 sporulation protein [Brevibacillus fluminis]